jgi:hypothetical protein
MTGWSINRFPKTKRWFAHFRHSSTIFLLALIEAPGPLLAGGDLRESKGQRRRTDHNPALVVEIAENNFNAFVFPAEEVLHGDLDVIESNISRTGRG